LFPYLGIHEASLSELLDSPPQSTILIHLFICKLNEPSINTNTLIYIHIKAIPLQAWTGPEGSRRLKLPDFKTIGT